MLDSAVRECRHALRGLGLVPGFSLAVVLTLALGIGASTAMFGAVRALLLEPLPYESPENVVMIWSKWNRFAKTWISEAEYLDYEALTSSFASVGAWSTGAVNLTGDGEPDRVGAAFVTASTFATLGVPPLLGRTFAREENEPGRGQVALISQGLWERRFGGDASALGRSISVNGVQRTIVGVMPHRFQLPTDYNVDASSPGQLWMPLEIERSPNSRGNHGLYGVARLVDGVSADRATAELQSTTASRIAEGLYSVQMQFSAFAVPVMDEVMGEVRPALLLLWGAVLFLLLIACVNVTNLLVVRSDQRCRELALRTAIGAGPVRLFSGIIFEGAWLSLAGTLAGLGVAYLMIRLFRFVDPGSIPRLNSVALDIPVMWFATSLTLGTTVLFSLIPSLRALRMNLNDMLKDGAAQSSGGLARHRFRTVLAAAQFALSVILLIGAGLAIRSFMALERTPLGFRPDNALTMKINLPEATYTQPSQVGRFYRELLDRVRALPGVESAGLIRVLPLADAIGDWGLMVEGYTPPPGLSAAGDWQVASDGALEALGETLVRGRLFTASDTEEAPPVALINETMARSYWNGVDPIGRRFRQGGASRPLVTVVGVVADVRHNGIRGIVKEKFYRPAAQFHLSSGFAPRSMALVVRSSQDPLSLAAPVREQVRSLDAALPISDVRTVREIVSDSVATTRFSGILLASFALIAVVMAALGVYSVLSFVVSIRMREFGVRMAVGAGRREIFGLVSRRAAGIAAVGGVFGLAGALGLTRFMSSLLVDVTPTDPATFAVVILLMAVIALVACVVPAWRASRLDPLRVLRPG